MWDEEPGAGLSRGGWEESLCALPGSPASLDRTRADLPRGPRVSYDGLFRRH